MYDLKSGVINFFNRNKKPLLLVAGSLGGIYYSLDYLKTVLIQMQDSMEQDSWAKKNISERFSRNQLDIQYTIRNLASELILNVTNDIDVECLLEELRTMQKSKKNKLETEHSAPVSIVIEKSKKDDDSDSKFGSQESFNQNSESSYSIINGSAGASQEDSTSPATYESSQDLTEKKFESVTPPLSIIGQKVYSDSVAQKYQVGITDEQNFLILSWWFLNKGWKIALEIISESVDEIVGKIPEILLPRDAYDYDLFFSANDLSFDLVNTERFNSLVYQAKDIFESDVVEKVFTIEISKISNILINSIRTEFQVDNGSVDSIPPSGIKELSDTSMTSSISSINDLDVSIKEFEDFLEVPETKLSLVKLLPRIAKEVNQILYDSDNQYNEALFSSMEMSALSASIYTARGPAI
ncbi:Peroxisomal biogenesis factor 3 [Smittium mucronatum]|uniref:Peroxisomal biogenesis factor 3 n=1 Tax=Smittium mucronatum TaxID=133383 RepID=A0A1R0H2S9_9FUNG|nr:Peroxisomal biogenesis factor 3 [Smittium mucronatum]